MCCMKSMTLTRKERGQLAMEFSCGGSRSSGMSQIYIYIFFPNVNSVLVIMGYFLLTSVLLRSC